MGRRHAATDWTGERNWAKEKASVPHLVAASYSTPGPLSGLSVSASGEGRGLPSGRFSPWCSTCAPVEAADGRPRCNWPLLITTVPDSRKTSPAAEEPVYQ